jgi:CSLREA domain-containing protein
MSNMRRQVRWVVTIATICGAAGGAVAHAATITVNSEADVIANDGSCTLREAIVAANTDAASGASAGECPAGSGADTIALPAGYYKLSIAGTGEDASLTGDLDITADATINGAGAATTTIDANKIDRVIDTAASTTVSIAGVTVTGGAEPAGANGSGGGASGQFGAGASAGGIRSQGKLSLSDCEVSDNVGGAGGNGATGSGGTGANGFGGFGGAAGAGAISSLGDLSIDRCAFRGNTGGAGGAGGPGFGGNGAAASVANTAGQAGGGGFGGFGGVAGPGAILASAGLTITGSTFADNVGGRGGAGGAGFGGFGGNGNGTGAGGAGGAAFGGFGSAGGAGAIGASGVASITSSTLVNNTGGAGGVGSAGFGGFGATGGATHAAGGAAGAGFGGFGGSGGSAGLAAGGDSTLTASTIARGTAGIGGAGGAGFGGFGGTGGAGSPGGTGGSGAAGFGGFGGAGGTGGLSTGANMTATNVTFHANAGSDGGAGAAGFGGFGGSGGNTAGTGGAGAAGFGGFGGGGGAGNARATSGSLKLVHATLTDGSGAGGGAAGTAFGGSGGSGGSGGGAGGAGGSAFGGSVGSAANAIQGDVAITLTNSVIAGGTPANCGGTVSDGGHNISFGGPNVCPGSHVDPLLGSLRDNGGPTETRALHLASPALDAVPATDNCAPTDQRGVSRPHGAACDIGAYERAAPDVVTGDATAITQTTATIAGGGVNPNARATSYHVLFGTTTAYDARTPDQSIGEGLAAVAESVSLTGLTASTTYHYRVVASNADGTTAGEDHTFTTAANPPPPPPAFTGVVIRRGKVSVKKGVAGVKVTCPAGTVGACSGKLTLTATVKRASKSRTAATKRITLGSATFTIAPGATKTVRVKLKKTARSLLARKHSLKATASATAKDGSGTVKRTTAAITLTLAKKAVKKT